MAIGRHGGDHPAMRRRKRAERRADREAGEQDHLARLHALRIAQLERARAVRRRASGARGRSRDRPRPASPRGSAHARRRGRGSGCRASRASAGSSTPGSTCALVAISVPSPTAKPVPRNWNCGVRVRSNVPIATIEPLTRSIVAIASAAAGGAASRQPGTTSAAISARSHGMDATIGFMSASGYRGARIGDGATTRGSYACRSLR